MRGLGLLLIALSALALALAGPGRSGWTDASFTSRSSTGASAVATGSLRAPASAPTATAVGAGVALGWTASPDTPTTTIRATAAATTSSCSGATAEAVAATTATSATDARAALTPGRWVCYAAVGVLRSWTSPPSPATPVQVGVVATDVSFTRGACVGSTTDRLDCGDTIAVTFNQPMDTATGPGTTDSVCATTSGTLHLASRTLLGLCTASETTNLGTITGLTLDANARLAATYAWSADKRKVTVTIQGLLGLPLGVGSVGMKGTGSFAPTGASGKLLSQSGAVQVCSGASSADPCRSATIASV